MAHHNLGNALNDQGKLDEAIAEYREAIRLKPDDAEAHFNLGNALATRGSSTRPSPNTATAIRLKPDDAEAHFNLGIALRDQGKLDEAIAEYREAIRLKPDDAEAHYNLGIVLCDVKGTARRGGRRIPRGDPAQARLRRGPHQPRHRPGGQGKLDEAIAEYREAIRLKPDDAEAHYNLGVALTDQGKHRRGHRRIPRGDPAQARLRRGPLQPRQRPEGPGEARRGHRRIPRGDPAQARLRRSPLQPRPGPADSRATTPGRWRCTARGHELGSRRPDWRYPSAEWVAQAERTAGPGRTAPGRAHGARTSRKTTPSAWPSPRWPTTASTSPPPPGSGPRPWRADPKLGDDRQAWHRYNAACAAALAAAGQGKDEPPPDDAAKAKLRGQALDWLKAELTAWGKLLESGPPQARPAIVQTLNHWKQDTDLAGIRDADGLAKLPADEQKAWRAFGRMWIRS